MNSTAYNCKSWGRKSSETWAGANPNITYVYRHFCPEKSLNITISIDAASW